MHALRERQHGGAAVRNVFLIDCEARGASPVNGTLTEFGAVHYATMQTFHGRIYESSPDPDNPAISVVGKKINSETVVAYLFRDWLLSCSEGRCILVSDNPAYDFMWIAGLFDRAEIANPFGHSGRRISDFRAGMHKDWGRTQDWKRLRQTKHDHNPVNDALGNAEALRQILQKLENTS
jgi:hypothetical protein